MAEAKKRGRAQALNKAKERGKEFGSTAAMPRGALAEGRKKEEMSVAGASGSKRILVTGANGFVGSYIIRALNVRGNQIRCAVRSSDKAVDGFENVIVGDITEETDWDKALADIDVVIHLVARTHNVSENRDDTLALYRSLNVDATLRLAQACLDSGVERFIFLSSIKVNGEETQNGQRFDEFSGPNPQDNYGITKYEAELGLKEIFANSNTELVIIRPPLIYGENLKGNLKTLQNAITAGLPLPLGCTKNKRSLVSLENLGSLIGVCIDHPKAANETLLVSDGVDLSTTEIVKAIASNTGCKARLICIPDVLVRLIRGTFGKKGIFQKLFGSLQVDINYTRALLNWQPSSGFSGRISSE